MRVRAFVSILFCTLLVTRGYSGRDTVSLVDYTKLLISTHADGSVYPVTSLEREKQAGFFLNGKTKGWLRVCNPNKLFIWVDGRLFDAIEGCQIYPAEKFFTTASDTIYLSFSSDHTLADFTCDLVAFEEFRIVRGDTPLKRNIRDEFSEFVIAALLILLVLFGFLWANFPARMTYIFQKAFTFKVSAYDFIATGFFTPASLNLLVFFSLALSFSGIYLDVVLGKYVLGNPEHFIVFFLQWVKIATVIFLLFILKWILLSMVAALFKFRNLKDYQMFDFLNFHTAFLILGLSFLVMDFILNRPGDSWIGSSFLNLFPIVAVSFVCWFTLKFVNNSPRKKLTIISYLCATEMIPLIFLMGFFYK